MNWLDQFLSGVGVPNIAGETNKSIDATPTARDARGPGGSFDTTRLAASLGPDAGPSLDYLNQIYGMQRDAMAGANTQPTRTGVQWLGDALSAASVPVAYAQGNEGYGRAMTGRTGADVFNQRLRDHEDETRKINMSLAGDMGKSYGEFGLGYLKDKREKTAEVRKTLAGLLAAGRLEDGSIDPASLADAEMFANTNGFKDEWEAIKASLPIGASPAAKSPAAAPAPVPDAEPAPDDAGWVYDPATGKTVWRDARSASEAPGGVLGGLSAMAGKLPVSAPGAAPPASPAVAPSPVFEPSPEVTSLIAKARRVSLMDPEAGKVMTEIAKERYKSELAIHEAKIKSGFDSRSGKVSTTNTFDLMNEETGEVWPGAPSADGTYGPLTFNGPDGKPLPMPDFAKGKWRYVPKTEQAGLKASLTEQGKAQGTAAASIPKIEDDYEVIMDLAKRLKDSKGLKNLTGKSLGGLVWSDQLPDFYEETGDARGLVQGLDSKAYITAFESLKGAGAITEKEGEAATLALSRLKNMRVSDEGYQEALDDFVSIVKRLRRQAYEKAQKGFTKPGMTYRQSTVPSPDLQSLSDDDLLASRPGAR